MKLDKVDPSPLLVNSVPHPLEGPSTQRMARATRTAEILPEIFPDVLEEAQSFSTRKLPATPTAPAAPTAKAAAARSWQYVVAAKTAIGVAAATAGAAASYAALMIPGWGPLAGAIAGPAALWFTLVKSKDALLGMRCDGTPVRNATIMRRFMPYVMPTRESARIDYQQKLDLANARAFVAAWNTKHGADLQITTFHVLLAAMQRANILHPGLNRFVIGKRIFQRNDYSVSFVVKSEKKAFGSLRTVKLRAIPGEDFAGYVRRINHSIHSERTVRRANATEKEIGLVERLPGPVISLALQARDLLDSEGLWPKSWIDPDPLYSSVFVANLGSLDKDEMPNVKHHLYECGTVSLFGTLCSIDESGPSPTMLVNWTYDERVNDAHYCLLPLKAMRQAVERPELLLGSLDEAAVAAGLSNDRAAADAALARENAH